MCGERSYAILAGLSLFCPIASQAQSNELLIPLDQETIAELTKRANFSIQTQTYFAKRYQVVRINFAALQLGDGVEFSVTPFDGLQMRAVQKSVEQASAHDQLREWTGELTVPEEQYPAVDLLGRAVQRRRPRISLWVRSGLHEIPLQLAREIAKERGDRQSFGGLPETSSVLSTGQAFTKLDLQTVSGQWFVPSLSANVVIRPLEEDPRFHVIYEEDWTKTPQGGHRPNEDSSRKLEQYQRFREQLREQLEEQRKRSSAPEQ